MNVNSQLASLRQLESVFSLDSFVEIFVPSTFNVSGKNSVLCESVLEFVETQLANIFGGSTSYPVVGNFVASDGTLVKENVTIVRSWSDGLSDENVDKLVRLAQHVKDVLVQESVAVVVSYPNPVPLSERMPLERDMIQKFYLV